MLYMVKMWPSMSNALHDKNVKSVELHMYVDWLYVVMYEKLQFIYQGFEPVR